MGTGRAAAALSDSPLSAGENDAGAGGAEKIHPLGKSPVLEDNGYVLAESGAILEYLQETWDSGGLLKPQGIDDKLQYRFWLHYAEGSLMPLLLMKLVFASLGKPPVPLAFARWVRCWARGYRKRGSIRSWPPMRGSLTTILPRGHGSLASG